MSHEPIPQEGNDPFVPLTDNNNALSWAKVLPLMGLVALLLFIALTVVRFTGYLQNEQQVDWRIEHKVPFKDSDENKFIMSKEEAEQKAIKEKEAEEAKPEEHNATEVKDQEAAPETNAAEGEKAQPKEEGKGSVKPATPTENPAAKPSGTKETKGEHK